jgi:hypothetical protein
MQATLTDSHGISSANSAIPEKQGGGSNTFQSSQLPPLPQMSRQSSSFANAGGNGFTLPPVQFDPAMDLRRQNLSPPLRAEDAVARIKKTPSENYAINSEATDASTDTHQDTHSHTNHSHTHLYRHHHHHHHHHHRSSNSPPNEDLVVEQGKVEPETQQQLLTEQPKVDQQSDEEIVLIPTTIKTEVIVSNNDVLEAAKIFPRKWLDPIIYKPQVEVDVLFPRLEGKENCMIRVGVSRTYIQDNQSISKRKVWGTDVYTDDSDLVAALYHSGHLKFDEEKKMQGTEDSEKKDDKKNKRKQDDYSKNGDCIATLLILPKLEKYIGSCRNGINSRSWLTVHDGVSIYVEKVEFVRHDGNEMSMFPVQLKKQRLNDWIQSRQIMPLPLFNFSNKQVKKVIDEMKERRLSISS